LNPIDEKPRAEKVSTLRVLHGNLEKIMCYLQHYKKEGAGEMTIEDFCQKIHGNIHKEYSERSTLSRVKLKNIVALYERIETRYFPYITDNLRLEFMI
jgi:hypothetical protein